jgi:hypothetical protein
MDRAFTEEQHPEAVIKHAGIAIQKTPTGRHLGVLYKQDGAWRLLHLAWHFVLCDNEMPKPGSQHLWVDPEPAVDEVRLEVLAGLCRLISMRNVDKGLPYGFSKPNNWFDPITGAARQTKDGMGLTCASFVLAVFSSNGTPLINEATWMLRKDDADFQNSVIAQLAQKATIEHLNGVRQNLPVIRYRPEEVAGAAMCDSVPADFAPCCAKSEEVLKLLQ